jgi:predicted amidophosphoribosyltransferase
MRVSDSDWRSLPRKQLMRQRPAPDHGVAEALVVCPRCGRRLEFDTDLCGRCIELVRDRDGNRWVHDCEVPNG